MNNQIFVLDDKAPESRDCTCIRTSDTQAICANTNTWANIFFSSSRTVFGCRIARTNKYTSRDNDVHKSA